VRSLGLATRAFQELPTLTSPQSISRLARSTCCQRPNPQSALAARFSRTPDTLEHRLSSKLVHLHSRLRLLKTNLSKLPQPFSKCQPAALIIRANVDFHDASHRHLQTTRRSSKSRCQKILSEVVATCKTLQSRALRTRRNCSEFTLALAPEFAFLSAYYQMFQGARSIQVLVPAQPG
jgi:hypothetical protein